MIVKLIVLGVCFLGNFYFFDKEAKELFGNFMGSPILYFLCYFKDFPMRRRSFCVNFMRSLVVFFRINKDIFQLSRIPGNL